MTQNKMKIGLMLDISERSLEGKTPTFRDLQAMAQAAEQNGFASLWLADHLIYRHSGQEESGIWEAFTMLSALAAVTSRISIAPLVACTSFRDPALLAKMAVTLDEISGGRFTLGLGAGWHQPEYEAFGYPFDHLAGRFEEALQIIKPLLRGEHVTFHGKYYQVNDCVLRPRGPSLNGPSILIGARRPRMLQLVARYADAWNTAWHVDPAVAKERYEQFKQACAEVGRDPSTVELTAGILVQLQQPTKTDASEKVITGSPEAIASKLSEFASIGASHLIVNLEPLTVASIEEFGRIINLL